MNLADLDKTGLVGIGSRVKYRLLIAGALDQIADYRAWLETQVEPGQQIQGIKESRPELRRALERAEQFLGLAALVAVILAGAAIAVAAHYFSQSGCGGRNALFGGHAKADFADLLIPFNPLRRIRQ